MGDIRLIPSLYQQKIMIMAVSLRQRRAVKAIQRFDHGRRRIIDLRCQLLQALIVLAGTARQHQA
jgi:hypothetical protein